MKKYRVTQTYSSGGNSYVEGQVLELDEATAAWMLRDVPGSIVPEKETPATRVVDAAPQDRMVSSPSKRSRE